MPRSEYIVSRELLGIALVPRIHWTSSTKNVPATAEVTANMLYTWLKFTQAKLVIGMITLDHIPDVDGVVTLRAVPIGPSIFSVSGELLRSHAER